MQNDGIDVNLKEIEGTISETGKVEVKVKETCDPCHKGRHNECNLTHCACAANNHKVG